MSKNEPTNGELLIMLENIIKQNNEMHKKQDYTNGKVRKNTEYRLRQEGILSFMKFVGIGNFVALLALLMEKFA